MPTRKLTDSYIRNYKCPDKRIEIYDSIISGLAVRITKKGTKSFVYRYRYGGKVKRYTFGQYPKIGLSKVRDDAKDLAYKLSKGIDPSMEVKSKVEDSSYTISDLAKYFKKRYLPLKAASTQETYKSRIDSSIVPELGHYPVKSLKRVHIIQLLEKIAFDDGQLINSNRTRAVLSSMLSFAVQKDIINYNPVKRVKEIAKEKTRYRTYTDYEIVPIWKAFEIQAEPIRSLLMFLLLNGQRLTETSEMKWSQLNDGIWTLSKTNTKNALPHLVPLSDLSMEILNDLKDYSDKSEFVFMSPRKKEAPIAYIGQVAGRIRKITGIQDFRFHDLRRTVGTNITRFKFSRVVAGKVLNHRQLSGDSQITAIYDRYSYMDEKKDALQCWADHIKSLVK